MRRIAVLDHTEDIRDVLRAVLTEDGHTVDCCAEASELGALIDRGGIDLVILDLTMGDVVRHPGLGIFNSIRQSSDHANLPVLAVSADTMSLEDIALSRYTRTLAKPFSLQQLEVAVEALLGGENEPMGADSLS